MYDKIFKIIIIIELMLLAFAGIRFMYVKKLLSNKEYQKYYNFIKKRIFNIKKRESYYESKLMIGIYLGLWEDSFQILLKIKETKLHGENLLIYYFRKILILFESGKIDQAKEEFISTSLKLKEFKDVERYGGSITLLKAINFFYCNDMKECKRYLISLIDVKGGDFEMAQVRYYLGRTYLNLGEIEEAKKYLNEAVKYGEKTFIETKAKEILAGI